MIRTVQISLVACAMILAGCESTQLAISPSNSQPLGENPDVLVLEKEHRVSVELLTPHFSRKLDELPSFSITVENQGDDYLILSTSGVRLMSGETQVPSYSLEEYTVLVNKAIDREAEEYNASQAATAMQTSSVQRTDAIRDNSQTIAQMTAAKAANKASARRQSSIRLKQDLEDLLTIHQLNPGESHTGLVKFHAEPIAAGEPLTLVVFVAGEPYEFSFKVAGISK
ncbi:hypothetical protein QEH56_21680 [Pelagicoccus enzymogenes]|uniref:hypothetical protein n=1 Tax=Pelagicoccus enzymogenes TaxID=2773457 RepID=UPI002810119A|nr:hypothetical protein [Pelagicoccus enzymogenes]MDQ8200793.1 hypothetical protein [Pelagicoccus enzymogenes]